MSPPQQCRSIRVRISDSRIQDSGFRIRDSRIHGPVSTVRDSQYRRTLRCVSDSDAIAVYLTYLRDVRRMSPNTVESYARDLALLGAFASRREQTVDALQRQDLETFV